MIAGALAVGALAVAYQVRNKMQSNKYDAIYQQVGSELGIDWRILKAISVGDEDTPQDPTAVGSPYSPDPSYGLMQISCRPDPAGNFACDPSQFDMPGWPPATIAELEDPLTNVRYGAYLLRQNIDTYGLLRGVAAYNDWGARLAPPNGPFPNQGYVDNFVSEYRALGGQV